MRSFSVLALILLVLLSGCALNKPSPRLSGGKARAKKFARVELFVGRDKQPILAKIKPFDARVALTAQAQSPETIKVDIKIADRGTGGNPVIVFLTKSGYVRQQYFIYDPLQEATATLLRFSAAKDKIKTSFKRAAEIYKLPLAYPAYLPRGLKLTEALYEDNIPGGPSTRFLFLGWSDGSRGLLMQFLPQSAPQMGRPPGYGKIIKLGKNLEAKLEVGVERADFFANDQKLSWSVSGRLTRNEFVNVIKGIRLSE